MEQMDLQEKVRRQYEKTGKPICRAGEIREEMLPMPDGARLLTEICLPEGLADEAFPVILMRSCYPSSREERELVMKEYACRGFGFVLQWCRGTGGSEGVWEPNVNERADGLATLDWLSAQPWVKNIGYWGDSYLALTGWCMADAVPEKVKTMVLGVYGTARFTSAYKDGLFRQDVLTHWAKENAGKPVDADTMESYRYRPQVEVDEALWGVRLPWYRDWITHTDANDPYWQQGFWGMLHNIPAQVKIPLFIREGWYDHHLGSALKTYDALPEEIRRKSLLQIGPWNHIYRAVIPQEKSEHALERDVVGIVDWFRAVLMRGETPKGGVQEYVIGADRWITRSSRAESGKSRVFYAGADSRTLGDIPPETDSKVSYLYDPENPVPSHGAECLLHDLQENGSLVQPGPNWRSDVISFVSAPLDADFTCDGVIRARLFVSSDAQDTAFTAKVMEIKPDGTSVNVRSGITTLAYRMDSPVRRTYTLGETVEVRIDLWDIAWRFAAGSRIRLDVSSSDFPQYSVHTNTPGVWSLQTESKIARQTLHTGKACPAAVIFPLAEQD